jgi:hypothetical protein
MLKIVARCVLPIVFLGAGLTAQDLSPRKGPSVTMVDPGIATVVRGKSGNVDLVFHISPGFHVNSNKPHAEFLIPTTLRLTAPTDIMIGAITYPPGQETTFPFAPDAKMSVYGSQFWVNFAVRPLSNVVPGKYAVHGQLKYQACDEATCYPPKLIPVDFQVKIVKAPPSESSVRNPAQSPHAHR